MRAMNYGRDSPSKNSEPGFHVFVGCGMSATRGCIFGVAQLSTSVRYRIVFKFKWPDTNCKCCALLSNHMEFLASCPRRFDDRLALRRQLKPSARQI